MDNDEVPLSSIDLLKHFPHQPLSLCVMAYAQKVVLLGTSPKTISRDGGSREEHSELMNAVFLTRRKVRVRLSRFSFLHDMLLKDR
jgi:hypothetical protein